MRSCSSNDAAAVADPAPAADEASAAGGEAAERRGRRRARGECPLRCDGSMVGGSEERRYRFGWKFAERNVNPSLL
jgi:hypothetical protein